MTEDTKSQKSHSKNYCRICFQEAEPLKKLPCSCKGSLSYMHDHCLNQMLHVKLQLQKQDVPDYIDIANGKNSQLNHIKVNCEICLNQILLSKQTKLSWERLMQINAQIYLILFGICCLSFYGVRIALTLLLKVKEDDNLIAKILYFGAHIWIIGVILFVMLEPLYSEIKTITYRIQVQNTTKSLKKQSALINQQNQGKNNKKKQVLQKYKVKGNTKILQKLKGSKVQQRQKRKLYSIPKNKNNVNNLRYFQI